jgi:ketosteroid isomerase-like protein
VTSPAELALVKIAAREYAARDFAGTLALADPLIRWDDRAVDPEADLVLGREDALAHLGDWIEEWDDYAAEIDEVRDLDGRVVVVYTEQGYDRSTGAGTHAQRAAVVTVERGAITSWARYLSAAEAMSAARAASEGAGRF